MKDQFEKLFNEEDIEGIETLAEKIGGEVFFEGSEEFVHVEDYYFDGMSDGYYHHIMKFLESQGYQVLKFVRDGSGYNEILWVVLPNHK